MSFRWTGMMLGCGAIATLGLAACGGGQTGDNGTDSGGCAGEPVYTNLTVEQADAKGYAVSETLAALRAGREEPGQPMLVTLPASLWQERGLEPPADRSGRGAFVIGSETELVEVSFTPPASCVDDENTPFRRLDITFGYSLRVEELDLEWSKSGLFSRFDDDTPFTANLEPPFDGDTSSCSLVSEGPLPTERMQLTCQSLVAAPGCLESSQLEPVPALPDTERSTSELIALANAQSPITLDCCDGSQLSVRFELKVPESYCSVAPAPALLSIGAAPFELEFGSWQSASLGLTNRICDESVAAPGVCSPFPSEEIHDGLERCSSLSLGLSPRKIATEFTSFSIWSDAAGELQLGVSLGSEGGVGNSGPYPRCVGQVPLR